MKLTTAVNYFISLFILCSPRTALPAFLNLTQGRGSKERKRVALWSGFAVAIILILVTFVGKGLLNVLEIRVSAFQCAGGIVVFLLALSMLNAQISPMRQTEEETGFKASVSIVPLAIPIMAGPGTISAVIVTSSNYEGFYNQIILAGCGAIVGLITAALLYFAVPVEKYLGLTGLNVVTRIGGLILAAMSIEIFARGFHDLFLAGFQ